MAAVCAGAAALALLVAHVVLARLVLSRRPALSPQRATAVLCAVLNLPMAMGLLVWVWSASSSSLEAMLALMYSLLLYNSVAYAYFHFFNLSETGRRVRLLLDLLDGRRLPALTDTAGYSDHEMVSQRLLRLEQMGQIAQHDGRYRLKSRFLWLTGRLIHMLGSLSAGRHADSTSP
jgi:hypothetical protein